MHDKPNRKLPKIFTIISISFVGLSILAGAIVCTWTRKQQWVLELPPATKAYTSYLPSSATIIEGWADTPDFFGDFTMETVFTLSDEELDKLLKEGWTGFPPLLG